MSVNWRWSRSLTASSADAASTRSVTIWPFGFRPDTRYLGIVWSLHCPGPGRETRWTDSGSIPSASSPPPLSPIPLLPGHDAERSWQNLDVERVYLLGV